MVTREVILSYRQNDPKAQEAVITEYFPLVRKIAYTQRRNHARGLDISDMIQEGLIALNEAVLRYDLDSEYLLDVLASVCIKRRIISYIRKQHSGYNIWNTVSLDLCINEEENLFLSDVISDNREPETDLQEYLEQLDEKEAEVLRLRLEGYRYREIAEKLKISEKEVDYRMRRITRRMRKKRESRKQPEKRADSSGWPEAEREIYERRQDRQTYEQIAKAMGISIAEVTKIMQRIRRRVRKQK